MAEDETTPTGDDVRAERPGTSWTERAEQAKRDGTWYYENEQVAPVSISKAERWRRFLLGFGVTLVVAVLARLALAGVTGRANPLDPGFLLDAVTSGVFLAIVVGLYVAFRLRRRRPGLFGR